MTSPNKFTKIQERKIREVGRKIETARLAKRMTIRTAAEHTITSSARGHMTDATWRRVENGYTQVTVNGKPEMITYRPTASTLMAMAEVVGLDGEELCRELELTPVPRAERRPAPSEIDDLKELARELLTRLDRLERDGQR